MNQIKIVVSHSGKQYVHQLLAILQKEGYLQLFVTSIWYKPNLWIYKVLLGIPLLGKRLYEKFLRKKTYPNQNEELIEQYPWKELYRQCLVQLSTKYRNEKYVFAVEKAHDHYVARRLKKLKPSHFIGYEKSSLESFKVVKSQGGVTILDLAQVHFRYLMELRDTQETFRDLFEDEELFLEINQVKAAEYDYADHIFTLSEFAKSTLVRFGIAERKIKVVNLGYNPAVFTPKTNYHRSSQLPSLRLIYTGTFTKRKGVQLLLQAVKELQLPGLELTIIGPVLDGAELFEKYAGIFNYYDFLHQEDLVKHLHEADVYVFPSYLDSWAMTVIEAMACGLPVIITENTGAKDAIKEGVEGFVLPIGQIEALKEKIKLFYYSQEIIETMGKNAAQAASHYTWDHYHVQVKQKIQEMIGQGRN